MSEIIVVGHRNPDVDSVAASHALAELKKAQGVASVQAACAGLPGARAEYLFERFQVPLPPSRNDVFPCVRNLLNPEAPWIAKGESLYDAILLLEQHHVARLPVVDAEGRYHGMLSLFALLGDLLQSTDSGLTGRKVRSSLNLIIEVLAGEVLSLADPEIEQDFEVYVAAMNVESMKEHIPRERPEQLALVVGDRSDIHLLGIGLGVRLMIITGSREIDDVVLAAARARGVSVIKTSFDSATAVRRLKFSSPVELLMRTDVEAFHLDQRINDIRGFISADPADNFPVVDFDGKFLGSFTKNDLDNRVPLQVVLVDHNEFDQGIQGLETVPVIEVVDHHRLGMPPTSLPIKITCDVVGSTCTLITEMFLAAQLPIPAATAGIMLGGIITDTLLLRSPTTTARDRMAVRYLEQQCGVAGEELMRELFAIGSSIARLEAPALLMQDKKDFSSGKFTFAVSQVEEASFEEFYTHEQALLDAVKELVQRENLNFFGLLVTNVVRETSLLLVWGDEWILRRLPYRKIHDHLYDLPGVLSRKKQLLPVLLKMIEL